jgi:probable F420-dependent oxidoreductase
VDASVGAIRCAGGGLKVDSPLFASNPADAGPAARRLEDLGYDGGFAFEGPHDPFLPLAVAATHTTRLELGTAIAVAFARSPMNLAYLAWDLQLASQGRFVLGLGTQVRAHVQRRFGMPWSRPAARMREMTLAIRAIWRAWQERERLDFQGEFYRHTLMVPIFDPGPNPHGLPRIFLAGVGARMTEVAGEVGDGFFVHPLHTPEFVRTTTLPALARGLARAGRDRKDFEISCQVMIATGDEPAELARAREAVRAQIAFYGSTPAYLPVLACHGREALHHELHDLSRRGAWREMAALVDDALLEAVAVVGPPHELASRLHQRCAFADRVTPLAPWADPVLWRGVVDALHR